MESTNKKGKNMSHANREYKDRLFKFIFGNPDHKQWTPDLYNAINGTDYKDPDEIQITTLENVVYMSMKNDISFLFADSIEFLWVPEYLQSEYACALSDLCRSGL